MSPWSVSTYFAQRGERPEDCEAGEEDEERAPAEHPRPHPLLDQPRVVQGPAGSRAGEHVACKGTAGETGVSAGEEGRERDGGFFDFLIF